MPSFNVFFFLINKPRPPELGATGPAPAAAPLEDMPEFQDFVARYTSNLRSLFERSIPHTPAYDPAGPTPPPAWAVNVTRIPESGPGLPDFSGLAIGARDPIVYLSRRAHSDDAADYRRASYVMLQAFEDGHFPGIPAADVSYRRSGLSGIGDACGIALIPWDQSGMTEVLRFAPLVPEVFSNLTPISAPEIFGNMSIAQLRGRWPEVMAGFLANASFHEIAHCKAESYNRQAPTAASGSATTPWHNTLGSSVHDVSGAQVLAAQVAWNTTASDADLQTMGRHMLCPIPCYRLDQPVGPQCYQQGAPHPIAPGPAPAASDSDALDVDELDI